MTDDENKNLKLFPCPACREPNKFAEEIDVMAMVEASIVEDLERLYKKERERIKTGASISVFNMGRLSAIEEIISIIRRDEIPEDIAREDEND